MTSIAIRLISAVFIAAALVGCGGGGSASSLDTPASDTRTEYYPDGLSVTSPVESYDGRSAGKAAGISLLNISGQLTALTTLVTSSTYDACGFNPEHFLQQPSRANCYGPTVSYEDHPDGAPANGSFPGGDLGLWLSTESSGEACTAAQMNQGMRGIGNKSFGALSAMAGMICVNSALGNPLPVNSTTDILAGMTTMAAETGMNAVFSSATIANTTDTGGKTYTYSLSFNYTSGAVTYPITLTITHKNSSTDGYQGRISYSVGNIPKLSGNCDAAVTHKTYLGSILYNKNSGIISVDARSSENCGGAVTVATAGAFNSGQVNPGNKYDAATNTTGWADGFYRFIASYDKTTYDGSFAYMWQAGMGDGHTRVLNVDVTKNTVSGLYSGNGWFGFGDDISTADGSIEGMICNWAGPGNSHAYKNYVQLQQLAQNSSGVFTPTADFIQYTPINSCGAGEVGYPTFKYDTDADSDLTDEVVISPLVNALKSLAEYTSSFTTPTAPTNF